MGLNLLKTNAPDLSQNPDMLAFVQNYTDMGFFSVLLLFLMLCVRPTGLFNEQAVRDV